VGVERPEDAVDGTVDEFVGFTVIDVKALDLVEHHGQHHHFVIGALRGMDNTGRADPERGDHDQAAGSQSGGFFLADMKHA